VVRGQWSAVPQSRFSVSAFQLFSISAFAPTISALCFSNFCFAWLRTQDFPPLLAAPTCLAAARERKQAELLVEGKWQPAPRPLICLAWNPDYPNLRSALESNEPSP
jgi:hypothetical protein